MKNILFLVLVFSFVKAEIVDRVVASVNNEPITSYDISQVVKNKNLSAEDALNYLIDKKILDEQIKKFGISVDEFDIENAMEKIAKQNGMSLFEFKTFLQEKGKLEEFKNQLRDSLLKDKLFKAIVSSKLRVSPEEIKSYYENHKEEFSTFKTVQVIAYYSNNPQTLEKIKKSPLISQNGVSSKTEVFEYSELPLNLMYLFKNTKVGEFTPIMNNGTNYIMYYVARKDGKVYLPPEKVKNIIASKIIAQKREEILKSYFAKVKNQANIKVYN